MVRNIIKKVMWYLPLGGKLSQAYEGEDILLWRLFTEEILVKNGFFIDVGAYHPRQYNNTWLLKKRLGFRGINIEPNEKGIKQFRRWRKDDINIQYLVGEYDGTENYKIDMHDASLSAISDIGEPQQIRTLHFICNYYLVDKIDLLSIDVEGFELDVLRGHNWELKPKVIICEINNQSTENFVLNKGYKLYGRTKRNGIYV